jgi:hypothetical protein
MEKPGAARLFFVPVRGLERKRYVFGTCGAVATPFVGLRPTPEIIPAG